MDDRNLWIASISGIAITVVGGLILNNIQQQSDESPNLSIAGDAEYFENKTVIPLQTRSTLPVLIFGYHVRLHDTPATASDGGAIPETRPLIINSQSVLPNQWYYFESPKLQITRESLLNFPIVVSDAQDSEWITADIAIEFGNSKSTSKLMIRDLQINAVPPQKPLRRQWPRLLNGNGISR